MTSPETEKPKKRKGWHFMKKRTSDRNRIKRILVSASAVLAIASWAHAEEQDTTVGQYRFLEVPKAGEALMPFEFHGYARAGWGINGKGGDQEQFWVPMAPGAFRLGNEVGSWGDVSFAKNWGGGAQPWVSMRTGLNFSTQSNLYWGDGSVRPNQAYVMFGNITEAYPDLKLWAGQRGYLWANIHIAQMMLFDQGGFGGGMEDLNLCFGKLNVNYVGASLDNFNLVGSSSSYPGTERGRLAKHTLDVHLHDVDVPLGKGLFYVGFGYIPGGELVKYDKERGYVPYEPSEKMKDGLGLSVGVMHTRYNFFKGTHKFLLQYARGININMRWMSNNQDDLPNPFNRNAFSANTAWRFRVADVFDMQPSECLSLMASAVYDYIYRGGGNAVHWTSLGVSPIWHLTEIFGIAFETGFEYIDRTDPSDANMNYAGSMTKFAIAPQLTPTNNYWSRPIIRAYLAYHMWSDGLTKSQVVADRIGGVAYGHSNNGLSAGLQAEAWW